MLDIDAGSPYCNPTAIAEIKIALETIGIVRSLLVRSSHSGGLHIYIPLPKCVNTFGLAVSLQQCLKAQGFQLCPGVLEIFPNVKTFGVNRFIEYNGHRLPLQTGTGSYLLNSNLVPIGSSLEFFLELWQGATFGQDIDLLQTAIVHAREARKRVSYRRQYSAKLQSWKDDMTQEMADGWTEPGQTNHLLKTIGCYGRVILGLGGLALAQHITEVAPQLPGYFQHCGHQSELPRRARAWASSLEKLYWPVGTYPQQQAPLLNSNQQKAKQAQERIHQAVEYLADQGTVPTVIGQWAQQIVKVAHCSLKTLYKYVSLWHPLHCSENSEPLEPCVKPCGESVSGSTAHDVPPAPKASNTYDLKPLHTTGGVMKRGGEDETPPSLKNSFPRGVWGEFQSFPQSSSTTKSPIPLDELYDLIQAKIRSLQWPLKKIRQFIEKYFQGRIYLWELNAHELTTCLYYLQVCQL